MVAVMTTVVNSSAGQNQNSASQVSTTPLSVTIAPVSSSESVIAVPPISSITTTIPFAGKSDPKQKPGNTNDWLRRVLPTNGLTTAVQPWHLVVLYDQLDENGSKIHSGTLEEVWVNPRKYKRIYSSDNLNQTDIATDQGLFRSGDQRWPNAAETQVRAEIVDPFHYAATLQQDTTRDLERIFGPHSLDCVLLENPPGRITQPTQYCFDHGGSALRYSWGLGWDQIAFNDIQSFQESKVAGYITVTHSGVPYLQMRLQLLESVATIRQEDFVPPPDAVPLLGKRVTGVLMNPGHIDFPEWPSSMREQHFAVSVEIVVGKDGRVMKAHAVSGPAEAYKAAESSARKWTFPPYLLQGEPVEVETKVILSNN